MNPQSGRIMSFPRQIPFHPAATTRLSQPSNPDNNPNDRFIKKANRKSVSTCLHYMVLLVMTLVAGNTSAMPTDTTIFCGTIRNSEYKIYITMDFYHQKVRVADEDLLGDMPGYLGTDDSNRRWFILEATFKNNGTVDLSFVNDDGSEDFKAELIYYSNGEYLLRHLKGSPLKTVSQKKWLKLPKELYFRKQ
ncbi:MAG: hypothetical protein PUK16_04340 [Prevotellaceae bacterium]|nr:hypothetical protein [Prevotella sp.]MDD7530171.1 hypothetical protein [Prevotellaceae bacterium]